jgi:hypothetical protein
MLGAGTIINPLLKIVTTVAILAAVYLFIVKPVLDTTEETFEGTFGALDGLDELPDRIQSEVDDALDSSLSEAGLKRCIRRAIDAGAEQQRISRCAERFGR